VEKRNVLHLNLNAGLPESAREILTQLTPLKLQKSVWSCAKRMKVVNGSHLTHTNSLAIFTLIAAIF
jgi:hypothetical protein